MIGVKFKKLKVIKKLNRDKNRHQLWLCRCDCGNDTIVPQHALKSGNTGSCGCMIGIKHGYIKNGVQKPEYKAYHDMKNRCYNKKTRNYKNYGGRGIRVCNEWLGDKGFLCFIKDMGNRPKEYSLERINVNKDYNKENCKWIHKSEQYNNMRRSIIYRYEGKDITQANLIRLLKLNKSTTWKRLKLGWDLKKTFGVDLIKIK